jgi:hypothetical protein
LGIRERGSSPPLSVDLLMRDGRVGLFKGKGDLLISRNGIDKKRRDKI